MPKGVIGVFEDSIDALKRRYSWTESMVGLVLVAYIGPKVRLPEVNELCMAYKFVSAQDLICQRADVYYVDGLMGRCFPILKALSGRKAYLVTNDEELERKAASAGYRTISEAETRDIFLAQVE